MTESLADLTAVELVSRYQQGTLSPVEVIEDVLARVDALEPKLFATYALDPEAARAAARESEQRWRRGEAGPLDGVPVTVKENIATRGTPIPQGTAATELIPATEDAPAAARLRAAGAVIFAKTTMPEYGMLSSGVSTLHPLTRNPWDLSRTAGGSSAGAAAAAAAGYGPIHVGTDIGGSIRLPAGWCGLVGLKPTHGRIAVGNPYPGRAIGPLTRTAADAALALTVMTAPHRTDHTSLPHFPDPYAELPLSGQAIDPYAEPRLSSQAIDPYAELRPSGQASDPYAEVRPSAPASDPSSRAREAGALSSSSQASPAGVPSPATTIPPIDGPASLEGLRIGLLLDAGVGLPVDPEVHAAVSAAGAALEKAGASVETIAPIITREMLDGLDRFWRVRSAADLNALPDDRRAKVLPEIRRWVSTARDLTGFEVFHGFSQMGAMAVAVDTAFASYDFLISPVAPITAFPAELAYPTDDPLKPFEHIAFTVPYNMSGHPATTTNCGYSTTGLPIGLQIAAPRFADHAALRLAAALTTLLPPTRPWPTP